jgi:hypothetical protein
MRSMAIQHQQAFSRRTMLLKVLKPLEENVFIDITRNDHCDFISCGQILLVYIPESNALENHKGGINTPLALQQATAVTFSPL